jgi:hypothetical protein
VFNFFPSGKKRSQVIPQPPKRERFFPATPVKGEPQSYSLGQKAPDGIYIVVSLGLKVWGYKIDHRNFIDAERNRLAHHGYKVDVVIQKTGGYIEHIC